MFDTFRIAANLLPEGKRTPPEEQDFQTKNFDCMLELYEVTEDGKLFKTTYKDTLFFEGERIASHNYTGEINFYDMEQDFVAWCVDGVVKEVIDLTGKP